MGLPGGGAGDRSASPMIRPADAGLERLKLCREGWQCETPEAPFGQEGGGIAAAGIQMADVSC